MAARSFTRAVLLDFHSELRARRIDSSFNFWIMDETQKILEAVQDRAGQMLISPYRELKPGEWNLVLGVTPAALRRRWRFMPDIWGDVIFLVGGDQRTTLARYWRCQDRAAKLARQSLAPPIKAGHS